MGGGGLAGLFYDPEIDEQREEDIYPTQIVDILPATFRYGRITAETVGKCKKVVTHLFSPYMLHREDGFFGTFWRLLRLMDVDGDVSAKLEPATGSSIPEKNRVVLRILEYLTSIPSDKFAVKRKIRSLGINHARAGIGERHMRLVGDVLLKSIASTFGTCYSRSTSKILSHWADLILFTIHQMTCDNDCYQASQRPESVQLSILSARSDTSLGQSHVSCERVQF